MNKEVMLTLVMFLLLVHLAQVPADALVRAEALYLQGDLKSAAQIYRGGVQRNPANEIAQTRLIRSLLSSGQVEAACAGAKEAQETLPSSSPILAATGDVHFRK